MEISFITSLFLLLLLSIIGAFFSGAETTFFSLSRHQLGQFKKSNQPGIKQLLYLLSKPKDLLITILIGNETINIALSILIANIVLHYFGPEHATLISITSA